MQRKIIAAGILSLFFLMGCASQQPIRDDNKWSPVYRIQAGANKGGIVENTDLTVVDNAGVDAFSEAIRNQTIFCTPGIYLGSGSKI